MLTLFGDVGKVISSLSWRMDIKFHYTQALEALSNVEKVAVVAHQKPDGDTLGAGAALLHFLRDRGLKVAGFCVDPIPDQYVFLPESELFMTDPDAIRLADLVIVCDASDLRYAGIHDIFKQIAKPPKMINFDHHKTNEMFGDVNVVNVTASSTAEVLHDFFMYIGAEITQDMATALLTGIVFDTGNFTNPATTVHALEAASDCLNRGAKMRQIAANISRNKPVSALRVWGNVFGRLKYDRRLGVASTVVFLKDIHAQRIDEEHVEGISNFLNKFLDVDVILVLKELPDGKVKGSFRSGSDVDVDEIASLLGGGGHKKAAGFTVKGKIIEGPHGWRIVK